jgi:RimJ/RimL family protein N-acetyltransferase
MTLPRYQQSDITVRQANEDDIDYIISAETNSENSLYIRQWSKEKHVSAINDNNVAYFVIENSNHRFIGYIILIGLNDPDKNLEFKRIVITEKGKGYGRDAVRFIKEFAFEQTDTNRLWLEVIEHNDRAFHIYESEGFKLEGVHRESLKQGDEFLNLNVMSILRREYK